MKGRLYFHHVSGQIASANAGAPSVLVAYGQECDNILKNTRLPGQYVKLNN